MKKATDGNDVGSVRCSVCVSAWTSYEKSMKVAPVDSCGGLGGFFENGMRWKDYIAGFTDDAAIHLEAIRKSIVSKGIQITGEGHQQNFVPIFSDGTAGRFSMRAWGDLMAAIWSEELNKDYCYMDFYM